MINFLCMELHESREWVRRNECLLLGMRQLCCSVYIFRSGEQLLWVLDAPMNAGIRGIICCV